MAYTVYIVRCADQTLYTGIATDVERRLAEHNGLTPAGTPSRRGARYTQARRPVTLVYATERATRAEAQREEARIKRLSRAAKQALVGASGAI
jgi:putative endonuclease